VTRILLADDSPHAQRMGERILREEGWEVVSVTDGETALKRLADVDPDLIVADVFLPGVNGFDLCRRIKAQTQHQHVRVVMTAGMLEVFDEAEARRAGADAIIKKPFEASAVVDTVKPLIAQARSDRANSPEPVTPAAAVEPAYVVEIAPLPEFDSAPEPAPAPGAAAPSMAAPAPVAAAPSMAAPAAVSTPEIDPELVRAAVTVALDEAMPSLIDDITGRVISLLHNHR
jgi:CheY-like chemotaxis protein